MLGVIVAAVAGVLAALIAVVFGAPTSLILLVTASVFLICAVMLHVLTRHAFNTFARDTTVRFPSNGPAIDFELRGLTQLARVIVPVRVGQTHVAVGPASASRLGIADRRLHRQRDSGSPLLVD